MRIPESEGGGWYIGVCGGCGHRIVSDIDEEPVKCSTCEDKPLCPACQKKCENNSENCVDIGCESCMIETEWGFSCCKEMEYWMIDIKLDCTGFFAMW